MDLARLSKLVQTALIRGGLEHTTLRDIRSAGERREDDRTLLEWTRARGSITRRDVMDLLDLSDTAAYFRLHRLAERRELEQVGRKYDLPGTVVPEEKQWEVISGYLREAGFAYCQDIAELLHISRRKTAGVLRRMVWDGRLLQFEKRYYSSDGGAAGAPPFFAPWRNVTVLNKSTTYLVDKFSFGLKTAQNCGLFRRVRIQLAQREMPGRMRPFGGCAGRASAGGGAERAAEAAAEPRKFQKEEKSQ